MSQTTSNTRYVDVTVRMKVDVAVDRSDPEAVEAAKTLDEDKIADSVAKAVEADVRNGYSHGYEHPLSSVLYLEPLSFAALPVTAVTTTLTEQNKKDLKALIDYSGDRDEWENFLQWAEEDGSIPPEDIEAMHDADDDDDPAYAKVLGNPAITHAYAVAWRLRQIR